ncbi:MAG: nucleotide-binding protein [Chloroflexi bacterium]|nr:nucleotide-binding protein [Chloroflexota bacterium]
MAIDNKKILVFPGRDAALRMKVVRFLETLGIMPIVIDAESSQGMTPIQKLDRYPDVGFAIVLMPGDERGEKREDIRKLISRSRENAIFELGYMIGKLGPANVCVLYESGGEIYNDIASVKRIRYDEANLWKLSIAQELNVYGLDINVSNLLAGDSTTDAPPPEVKKKKKQAGGK